MFTIDDPELTADELARRVRDDVEKHRARPDAPDAAAVLDAESAQRWAAVHRAISTAEVYVPAGTRMPEMSTLRGLSRRLAVPIVKVILRVARLVTRDQTIFNAESMNAVRALAEAFSSDVRAVEHRLTAALHAQTAALEAHGRSTAALTAAVEAAQRSVETALAELRAELTRTNVRANGIEHAVASWRSESITRFDHDERTRQDETAQLRMQLLVHERALRIGAEQADPPRATAGDDGLEPLLAAFYSAFEDRFRGSRDEIKRRVSVYLPIIREAGAGVPERPVLDLGCGRGEWLEVLGESGLAAAGLDANPVMVAHGRAHGLDVAEGDALDALRARSDASAGAVTAFHLIEHLPFGRLVALVDEMVRVLAPGGVLVLETPNPTNLIVGASSFYIDPTHHRPLHPETMRFLVESRGLVRVDIRPLHPADASRLPDDGGGVASRLNEQLYGPQDYAVVAYRP